MIVLIMLIIILTAVETCALLCLNKYHSKKNKWYFLFAISLYVIICLLIVYSLNFKNLIMVNTLWNIMTILLVTLIGYFILKEKLTKYEIVSIVLAIFAIIFAVL